MISPKGFAYLLLVLASLVVLGAVRSRPASTAPNAQRGGFDENRFPIADYLASEPTDPVVRARLRARSQKHNNSDWGINPNGPSDTTVKVDSVDPNLPAIPFKRASAIIIGKVKNARASLSDDKTGIFSTFEISIEEVLKNASRVPLSVGAVVEADREGGRVRFPSGRLHLFLVKEQNMPQVNSRYVLFLEGGDDFQIITAYELREGRIYPLDDLVQPKTYENAEETTFLSELRTKLSDHP